MIHHRRHRRYCIQIQRLHATPLRAQVVIFLNLLLLKGFQPFMSVATAFAAKRVLPPASVGSTLSQIQTPSLLVSLPVLESNESQLYKLIQERNKQDRRKKVRIRPHFKAHKSSALAKWQLDRAAALVSPSSHNIFSGFCVQTITEAETLVKGLKTNISVLLTNSPGSLGTAERLALLSQQNTACHLSTVVDCKSHIEVLKKAIADFEENPNDVKSIGVYVEVECGQDRCGAPPGSSLTVELAQMIMASPHLVFEGLHVYHGGIQHVQSSADRLQQVVKGPAAATTCTMAALRKAGIDTSHLVVTGGGTGTLLQDLEAKTHTEVQPGSYLFMDGDYQQNEEGTSLFQQSLYVHTTVISRDKDKAVIDAGTKAVDLLCGMPTPTSLDDVELAELLNDVTFTNGGDEHGILKGLPSNILPVGSTLQLIPSHCDPTVNLHDWLITVNDDGVVEDTWPVDAKGYRYY